MLPRGGGGSRSQTQSRCSALRPWREGPGGQSRCSLHAAAALTGSMLMEDCFAHCTEASAASARRSPRRGRGEDRGTLSPEGPLSSPSPPALFNVLR